MISSLGAKKPSINNPIKKTHSLIHHTRKQSNSKLFFYFQVRAMQRASYSLTTGFVDIKNIKVNLGEPAFKMQILFVQDFGK